MTRQQLSGVVAILVLLIRGAVDAQTDESTGRIPSDQVARAFGYDGTLEVEDITDRNRRKNPRIISSHVYSAADHTFAPTTITLGPAGSILTKELASEFRSALEKERASPATPSEPIFVREVALDGERSGFVFLSGVGPGGTGYSAVLNDPQQNRDIAVAVNFSAANPVQKSERNQLYFENLMRRDHAAVLDMLRDTIPQLAALADTVLQSRDKADLVISKAAATPALSPSFAPQEAPVAVPAPTPAEPNKGPDENESNGMLWALVCVIVALAFTAGALAWRKRQRVPS